MAENVTASNAEEKAISSAMTQCYENYIIVDVGANLTNKKYSRDLDSVIQRAKDAGVQKIMVTGASIRSSKEALRLTRIYPGTLYSTAGVHPHDAKSWENPDTLQELESIANNPECVAIGECGLDYSRDFSDPETQRAVFHKQVELACQLTKPLIIHERGAQTDVLEVLNHYKSCLPPVLIHSFIGTVHVKDALTERSMTFLHRYCTFQRNEPCALPAIVEMVAAFMQISPEEVALATAFNALKLFGLNQ